MHGNVPSKCTLLLLLILLHWTADKLMSLGDQILATAHPKINLSVWKCEDKEGLGVRKRIKYISKINLSEFSTCGVHCINIVIIIMIIIIIIIILVIIIIIIIIILVIFIIIIIIFIFILLLLVIFIIIIIIILLLLFLFLLFFFLLFLLL